MPTVGDWVGELTTTTGTGDIELGGALEGFASFEDIGSDEVWYVIVDGNNKESGWGAYSNGTISRDNIQSTLVDGVFNGNSPAPISLSGLANVYCPVTAEFVHTLEAALVKLATIEEGATADQVAAEVPYDNTSSGISSTDVQNALDTLVALIQNNIAIEEVRLLEAGQTNVVFNLINAETAAFYIVNGENLTPVDRGRLSRDFEYNVLNDSTIVLTIPPVEEGTILIGTGVEFTPQDFTDVIQVFLTVADMQSANPVIGRTVAVSDGTTIQFYFVKSTDDGSGVTLPTGNFANPVKSADLVAHENALDPHPQYLTPEELPSVAVSWMTNVVSSVDAAYLESQLNPSTNPESSVSATGSVEGTPVLLGQWMREVAFDTDFQFVEAPTNWQLDLETSNDNVELYGEIWIRRQAGGDELLATSGRLPINDTARQTFVLATLIPDVSIFTGDRSFIRLYVNKTSGGVDPTVTLYMEGNDITRTVTYAPTPAYPAEHETTHREGGTDELPHDELAGAKGFQSHSQIDAKLAAIVGIRGSRLDNPIFHICAPKEFVKVTQPGLEFTRASTATYIDVGGILRYAAIDEPREEAEGWLFEGTSENILLWSEDFSQAEWANLRSSVVVDQEVAPDGNTTADSILDTIDNNTHAQRQNIDVVSGQVYTASCFAKSNGRNFGFEFRSSSFGERCRVAFDLVAGTAQQVENTVDNFSITDLGNGWFYCTATKTAVSTETAFAIEFNIVNNNSFFYTGDGASGVFMWGAQIEALPFASSYIPTTTTAATRSADWAQILTDASLVVPGLGREFTVSHRVKYMGQATGLAQISWAYRRFVGDIGDRTNISRNTSDQYSTRIGSAPIVRPEVPDGEMHHFAMSAFEDGVHTNWLDGIRTDVDGTDNRSDPDIIEFGIVVGANFFDGSNNCFGHIQDLRIYDFALTDTEAEWLAGE